MIILLVAIGGAVLSTRTTTLSAELETESTWCTRYRHPTRQHYYVLYHFYNCHSCALDFFLQPSFAFLKRRDVHVLRWHGAACSTNRGRNEYMQWSLWPTLRWDKIFLLFLDVFEMVAKLFIQVKIFRCSVTHRPPDMPHSNDIDSLPSCNRHLWRLVVCFDGWAGDGEEGQQTL